MWGIIIPTSILIAAVIDDLKTRKVHNWLILTLAGVALLYQFFTSGPSGLIEGGIGMTVGVAVCLPLVLAKAMGAGDMKLLGVLGLATNWSAALWTGCYSLAWGALLGILQAVLSKQGLALAKNTIGLLKRADRTENEKLHRIPYTVALFFGWLTYVSLNGGFRL